MIENTAARILVVDDEQSIRELLTTMLNNSGYIADCAEDAKTCLTLLAAESYDVIITDIKMPGISGMDLLKTIHHNYPDIPVILMTGNPDLSTATEAVRTLSVVDYLTKPFAFQEILMTVDRAAELKQVRDENKRLTEKNMQYQKHLEEMVEEKSRQLATSYRKLEASYDFSLEAMVAMLDARERATGRHSIRVRDLVMVLANKLNLPKEEQEHIARGTLLHDIGKVGIPDAILLKQDCLTDEEWDIMRTHVQIGYDFVKASPHLEQAAEIVLSHHEKFDGSGYPRGLKGDAICLGARIFSVIDAYDAMRSVRVYQDSIPEKEAMEEICNCSGSHFDPDIIKTFMECHLQLEKIGKWSELADTT